MKPSTSDIRKAAYIPQRVAQAEADAVLGEKARLVKRGNLVGIFRRSSAEKHPVGYGSTWLEALISTERSLVKAWMDDKGYTIHDEKVKVSEIPDEAWGEQERPSDDVEVVLYCFKDTPPAGEIVPRLTTIRSPKFSTLVALFRWWREHRHDPEHESIRPDKAPEQPS